MIQAITTEATIPWQAVLQAYANGVFPMAREADNKQLYWLSPDPRAHLPLDGFHLPRSLRKVLRRCPFEVRYDSAFTEVLEGCAGGTSARPETWINAPVRRAFRDLFHIGFAHSVECWQDGKLVGGLYGLSIGGAFFGESMFSRADNASKVALCHLVATLRANHFTLLDIQFMTPLFAAFGAVEEQRSAFLSRLAEAVSQNARFIPAPASPVLPDAAEAA